LKYPKMVFKRIHGQRYYHGIGDSVIENLIYEREVKMNIKRKVEELRDVLKKKHGVDAKIQMLVYNSDDKISEEQAFELAEKIAMDLGGSTHQWTGRGVSGINIKSDDAELTIFYNTNITTLLEVENV